MAAGGLTDFGARLHDRDFTVGEAFSTGGGGSTSTMMLVSPV